MTTTLLGHIGSIYLLHFSAPISPKHTTQHYLGWTVDLEQRLWEHERGIGARLTQVAKERGITFTAHVLGYGDRHAERRIKRQHHSAHYCPDCCRAAGRPARTPVILRQQQSTLELEAAPEWDFGMVPGLNDIKTMDSYEWLMTENMRNCARDRYIARAATLPKASDHAVLF